MHRNARRSDDDRSVERGRRELRLSFNPAEGIRAFDTSEHEVYTEEEPNALTSEETSAFLACMEQEFPAQYAMAFLGFATGLRPLHATASSYGTYPGCPLGPGRHPRSAIAYARR